MKKLAALATLTLAIPVAHSAIVAPYLADANTLHLWHFDEADNTATTTADAVGGVALNKENGATLGNASFSGFGRAGNTSGANINSRFLSTSTFTPPGGSGGAFTYEAMINISTTGGLQQIFSMDNNQTPDFNTRPFQFRIYQGSLELVNIAPGVQTIGATIPITGDDAFVANQWFHVAVTYNGAQNTAGNLALYWTRVDESRTAANSLGSFDLVNDLTGTGQYGAGNDGRTIGNDDKNLEGLIDEVRISNVARGADQMLFAIPEPSAVLLGGLGALLLLRRRRH